MRSSRRALRASWRCSSVRCSTSSTPSRWSISCWNTRAGVLVELEVELSAVEVVALHVDLRGAEDLPAQAGHRQAALDEVRLAPALDDGGVEDHARPVVVVVDEEALLHPHLRGGEPDAGGLVHGDEHVVDELDERAVDLGDLGGAAA